MVSTRTVDITKLEWPLCLLQCNREVDRMNPGEELEVIVDDPDVAKSIMILIRQMAGFRIKSDQKETHFHIHIIKMSGSHRG